MGKRISLIDNIKIAAPCSANWQEMSGDDNMRFCQQCQLNVYNISNLTEKQIEELFIAKEGKLCVRLYRRKDGTVLVTDCPTGLKLLRQRTNKIAKAIFSSCLTLLMTFFIEQNIYAKNLIKIDTSVNKVEANKISDEQHSATIYGVVADETNAVIAGTKVIVINEENNDEIAIMTDEAGNYKFDSLKPGKYRLKAETAGFQTVVKNHVDLTLNQKLELNLNMKASNTVEMGVFVSSCSPKAKKGVATTILTSPAKLFHKLLVTTQAERID